MTGSSLSCALLAACIVLSATAGWAQEEKRADEITVAAAADLSIALKEIGDNYEKKTGVKVNLSFGASGALAQQIQNGAPFDLFFSADMDYPRQLIAAGEADGATLRTSGIRRVGPRCRSRNARQRKVLRGPGGRLSPAGARSGRALALSA